jgi:hypothetical protein
MNNRIKELAEQAVNYAHDNQSADIPYHWLMLYSDKLSELIVMECGNIVSGLIVPETPEQDIGPYEKWNQALGHAALEIEQHFFGDAHK